MNTHFRFIARTKIWFAFSLTLIVLGAAAMVFNVSRYGTALNYGIDFTGGSLLEFRFEKTDVSVDALKTSFSKASADFLSQITATDQGTVLVQGRELSEPQLQTLLTQVKGDVGAFELLRFTTIGPKIGSTLKQKAALALVLAMIAIVLYLAYAFRKVPKRVSPWRFGICAILALFHDVFITIGAFAFFWYEVDALFITALLTIIGFSVHDTIVVFDRIRENLKKQNREQSFEDVADISLNQTLGRSINTSVSTLFPLVALYIWGAPSLQHFTFALLVGIVIGTYSSIFIASPLLALWQARKGIK